MYAQHNTHEVTNQIGIQALNAIGNMFYNINLHVGDYKMSSRSNDFGGWLLCDGRSVLRSSYPELFRIIGTSFGPGTDSNSFNIPNTFGRVAGSRGQGFGLTNRSLGDSLGAETHVLTLNEMPSHRHTGITDANGEHSHTINDPTHAHSQTTINDDFNGSGGNPPGFTDDAGGPTTWNNINAASTGISINSNGNHQHAFSTSYVGSNFAHNNMQPTIFVGNMFIFATQAKYVPPISTQY